MSALTAPLDEAQLALLKIMAEPYLARGQWPVWYYVQQTMDDLHLDAEKVLKSLPMVGSTGLTGPSYGLATYDRNVLQDDSRPALTVAAGLHSDELQHVFGDNFIRVLQYLVQQQRMTRPTPDEVTRPSVTSADLKQNFPGATDEFLAALEGIFQCEPPLRRCLQSWGVDPKGWQFILHRDIQRYRNVNDLRDYVERVTELIEEQQQSDSARYGIVRGSQSNIYGYSPTFLSSVEVPSTITPAIERPQYVNTDLIIELEQKHGQTKWSLDKLLQLLRELDSNYAVGNAYSCHTLLRAVIDHVPRILGHPTFEVAVPNYKWTRTDKKYMTRLLDFKTQADDVLHRPIRTSKDVITMHDLPQAAALNALLRECIDKL